MFCIFGVIAAFGMVYGYTVFQSAWTLFHVSYKVSEDHAVFYVMWALLVILFTLCIREKKYMRIWYVCVLLFGAVLIVGDTAYSPIDEASHLDYIQYIIEHHELPTMWQMVDLEFLSNVNGTENMVPVRRYEAVQMPLYYLLMAVLAAPVRDLSARFIVIRFFGLACLAGVAVLTERTLRFLQQRKLLNCPEEDLNLILALTAVNPGILVRFVRVSNEPLAVLLSVGIFYCAVRLLADGYHAGIFRLGAMLSVFLYYTKSTGAFFVGAILLVLLYYKKWMHFVGLIVFYVSCAVPWFFWCYWLYGSLTGMNEHVNIVLPIVNPNHEPINLVTGIYRLFTTGFFQANEVAWASIFCIGMMETVNILLFAVCLTAMAWSLIRVFHYVFIQRMQFDYSTGEKKQMLSILSAGMIFCDIALLALATAANDIGALIGRYLYFIIPPMILLLLNFMESIKLKRGLSLFFCMFYGLLFLQTLCHYTDTAGKQHGLWGKRYEQAVIEACIPDRAGRTAGVGLKGHDADANQLAGKVLVADHGQNAVIDHVEQGDGRNRLMFGYPVPDLDKDAHVCLYDASAVYQHEYNSAGTQLVELGGLTVLEQSFVWQGGSIQSIRLMTATYQTIQHGNLHISLLDRDGKTVQEAFADMQYCVDNGWVDIWFYHAQKLEPGTYKLQIKPFLEEGSAICIYAGDADSYADGELLIEDTDVEMDINFQIGSLDADGKD